MPTTNEQRTQLDKSLTAATLGERLTLLKKYTETFHFNRQTGELQDITDDYGLMKQYMGLGFKDEKRTDLFHTLEYRLYNVYAKLKRHNLRIDNISYAQAAIHSEKQTLNYQEIDSQLDTYSQNLTLASLAENAEDKQKVISIQQHEYRKLLFDTIYTSELLTEGQAEALKNVMLSPVTESIDTLLIVSALMLAQQEIFDPLKLRLLCQIYAKAENKALQVRSLVAIAFSLPVKLADSHTRFLYRDILLETFSTEEAKADLLALIYQILKCMSTREADKVMKNEIIPTLSKNARHLHESDLDGSTLDEILHPDREELEMDKMEETVKKVREMADNGFDIFYSGFSHSKRYSFFYTLMNWFYPFTISHPQLNLSNLKELTEDALETLLGQQAFCNSDKYSFALTINGISVNLPKSLVDMINQKITSIPELLIEKKDKKVIMREYMQDLYRFYTLYPNYGNFSNPFAEGFVLSLLSSGVFEGVFSDADAYKMIRLIMKSGFYREADKTLSAINDKLSITFLKTKALISMKLESYKEAGRYFMLAFHNDENEKKLLLLAGNAYCRAGAYMSATHCYDQYISQQQELPDDCRFNYAKALFGSGRCEEALKDFFRIYFEHEDDDECKKYIIYCYVLLERYDDAVRMAEKVSEEAIDKDVIVAHAVALICKGKLSDGAEHLAKCIPFIGKDSTLVGEIDKYKALLTKVGIGEVEKQLLVDIAYSRMR